MPLNWTEQAQASLFFIAFLSYGLIIKPVYLFIILVALLWFFALVHFYSWPEATRYPTNPCSQLCPFLSSPIKNFLLMVFFLSHFSLSLSALQQNLLCHQLNIICTIAKFVSPVRLWNRKLCIFSFYKILSR